jgi:hypothetical protein
MLVIDNVPMGLAIGTGGQAGDEVEWFQNDME